MRRTVAWAALVFLAPTGVAQGLLLGNEEFPELPPSGPPQYAPTYGGARDHDYLRLLAGWFAYDNSTDVVVWTLKVEDGSGYQNPPPDYYIGCAASGNITVDEERFGTLHLSWTRSPGRDGSSGVRFTYAEGNMGGTGQTFEDRIPHGFRGSFDAPAYFEYRINRSDLLRYGTQIQDFAGRCSEFYEPHPYAILLSRFTQNFAESESDAAYSFEELRRVRGPDGRWDPIEEYEQTAAPPAAPTTAPVPDQTPALSSAATILLAAAGFSLAVLRLRRR